MKIKPEDNTDPDVFTCFDTNDTSKQWLFKCTFMVLKNKIAKGSEKSLVLLRLAHRSAPYLLQTGNKPHSMGMATVTL